MNLLQHARRAGQPTATNSIQTTPAALILLLGVLLMVMVSACRAEPALESGSSSLFGVDDKHVGDKRPFFVGSRYGRSHIYGAKDIRQVNVVPRNDRFFLGSRYGKRSDALTKEIETDNNNGSAELTYLACMHTGVSNLYRCFGKERDPSGSAIQQYAADNMDSSK